MGPWGAKTNDFGTGNDPNSVAIGDLNGDGRPDLATANSPGGTISVLLGNADGSFGVKTDYSTGSGAGSVAIGDLNGDGKPDLATANAGYTVSVLLGNGNGSFGVSTECRTGGRPQSVAIGDLNGDGKPDLAAATVDSGMISVLLGNGDGTFGAHTDFGNGIYPYSVAIGDLNGDRKLDLATANHSGTVSVLLGNGDGSFGVKTDFGTGGYPNSVAIGDLNGDGKPDLATANLVSNTVSVLLGNGDGSFRAHTDFETGRDPLSVVIADLNGDGKLDLATANYGSNTVSVLLGDGVGGFGMNPEYGIGSFPVSLVIGDVNADGKPDLAVAHEWSTVSVLLNTGSGGTTATLLAEFDASPRDGGIELRWSFGDRSRVSSVAIERTQVVDGPWAPITPELRQDGDVTAALDRTADPGQAYFYRLVVRLVDGTGVTFGPVSSTRRAPVATSTISLLGPNPTNGRTQIQYDVARAGRVRLAVADVSGRVVATLVDGIPPPGRYQVSWDGTKGGQRLAAGLYFVRLTAPDRTVVRKLATIR